MKTNYLLIIVCFFTASFSAQTITIPDANFKAKLLQSDVANSIAQNSSNSNIKIDSNNDGEIQVSEAQNVHNLFIDNSNISDLTGISYFKNLYHLICSYNNLSNLDLSETNVFALDCSFNPNLTWINIKNGVESGITFCCPPPPGPDPFQSFATPNLSYICIDQTEIESSYVLSQMSNYGYFTCEVNTYCTFNPGGDVYAVTGTNKINLDGNGCEVSETYYPHLKFLVSNGVISTTVISNSSGEYYIPFSEGDYTITPIMDNPSYFSILPTSVNVNFTLGSENLVQDFCITPTGTHNDLEVTILPINQARPGFDATYIVSYRNKGNSIQSGTITFAYDDNVMDYIYSNFVASNLSSGLLTWNFTDLSGFESRSFLVTFNLNSPVETPPLNSGSILNYSAEIIGLTDEYPTDNSSILNQTVVNSFDPNDKTCLEGATIAPSEIGEYVHYIIRFENTGTANAENVVVKDVIDISKFDLSSLIPIGGSHSFVTRINSNTVEFIFENINLPFAAETNDGYVAFKIRTKSNLVVGNSFTNSASIYFDYNAPILTNTAVTTIQTLNQGDFEFDTNFELAPNPVSSILGIKTKNDVSISSISIYNALGQLVNVITNPKDAIDVSHLMQGTYFIKLTTNKGVSNSTFIKK